MIRSILIGFVAGARSMTPLAAVSDAARRGTLPAGNGAPALLGHPLVSAGTALLAAAELGGDKIRSAPDRIILPGIAARLVTASIAGMALAPRRHRVAGALLAAGAAVLASYATFAARMHAMETHGQTETGLIEDGLIVSSAVAIANAREV